MGNRTAGAVSRCLGVHAGGLLLIAALLPDTLGGEVMPMRNGPDIVLRDGLTTFSPFALLGLLAAMEVGAGLAATHWATRRRALWAASTAAGLTSFVLAGLALAPRPGPMARSTFIAFGWSTAGAVALVVVTVELFLAGILRPPQKG